MKRGIAVGLALLAAAALLVAGCSKEKEKQKQLEAQVSQLQAQVQGLETQRQTAKADADQAALKSADDKRQMEENAASLQTRLMLQPLNAWEIRPGSLQENGWLIIDGDRTYNLNGYEGARTVRFFFAQYVQNQDPKPTLLGEDTNGSDGWSWTGPLPSGNMKAVWAEVAYGSGVKVNSPVLPIRAGGK
jgi:outer membrane murein-binding lipoprotein Lpp